MNRRYPLMVDGASHTGQRTAVLWGGDSLFQAVTVPAGGKLRYYLAALRASARHHACSGRYTTHGSFS